MKNRQWLIELRGDRPRKDVAKHLGITPQMLGMVERGDRGISLNLAKKIADFYCISMDDITNKIFLDAQTQNMSNPSQRKEARE